MASLHEKEVPEFLRFGYLPSRATASFPFSDDAIPFSVSGDLCTSDVARDVLDEGRSILSDIFEQCASQAGRGLQIVPLSGGLDSRLVLGGVRTLFSKEDLVAVSFGTPKTLDYELGRKVANAVGVRSVSLDLRDISVSLDDLVGLAAELDYPVSLIDAYFFRAMHRYFGNSANYWVGFLGDPLAGSHLPTEQSDSADIAVTKFLSWNRFGKVSVMDFRETGLRSVLLSLMGHGSKVIALDDLLDLAVRQMCYVRPTVIPNAYTSIAPFVDKRWVQFMLNLPWCDRKGEKFYRKLAYSMFPDLFSLPLKVDLGLSIDAGRLQKTARYLEFRANSFVRRFVSLAPLGTHPMTNYIDYDAAFRRRDDFKELFRFARSAWADRSLVGWEKVERLWRMHQMRMANFGDFFRLLVSAAVFLKSDR